MAAASTSCKTLLAGFEFLRLRLGKVADYSVQVFFNFAGLVWFLSGEDAGKGGFTGAIDPHNGNAVAFVNSEIESVEDDIVAVGLV